MAKATPLNMNEALASISSARGDQGEPSPPIQDPPAAPATDRLAAAIERAALALEAGKG